MQTGGNVNFEMKPDLFPSAEGRVCQTGGSYGVNSLSPASFSGPQSGYGGTTVNAFQPRVSPFPLGFKSLLGGGRRKSMRRKSMRRKHTKRRSLFHVRKNLHGCMRSKRSRSKRSRSTRSRRTRSRSKRSRRTRSRSKRSRSTRNRRTRTRNRRTRTRNRRTRMLPMIRAPMQSGGGGPLMPANYADASTLGYGFDASAAQGGLSALANPMPFSAYPSCV
jgi:hypothetical protein